MIIMRRWTGRQYGAVSFNTASGDKSPVSVTARLEYSHEMGQANFGGVSLVFGHAEFLYL